MLQSIYQIVGASFFWLGAIIVFMVAWMRITRYLVSKYRDEEIHYCEFSYIPIKPKPCKCSICVNRETCENLPDEFDTCKDHFNLK